MTIDSRCAQLTLCAHCIADGRSTLHTLVALLQTSSRCADLQGLPSCRAGATSNMPASPYALSAASQTDQTDIKYKVSLQPQ
jgi:hypothetical protein